MTTPDSTLGIRVDEDATAPPYEQVREQLRAQVEAGELTPGTRLPTVRRLAEDLGLATNTVARAYRELEAEEVIETRGRNGSFVRASGDALRQKAESAARAYADRVEQLGLSPEDALAIVTAALRS